jgi:hypothetical protein
MAATAVSKKHKKTKPSKHSRTSKDGRQSEKSQKWGRQSKPGKDPLNRYYTPNDLTIRALRAATQVWNLNSANVDYTWVDMGAGANSAARILGAKKYVSYDVSPPPKHYGTVNRKDWLAVQRIPENSVVGFNPPYGYRSLLAKDFVKHAIELGAKRFCLLVPVSTVNFLKREGFTFHVLKPFTATFTDQHDKRVTHSGMLVVAEKMQSFKKLPTIKDLYAELRPVRVFRGNKNRRTLGDDVQMLVRITGSASLNHVFAKFMRKWYRFHPRRTNSDQWTIDLDFSGYQIYASTFARVSLNVPIAREILTAWAIAITSARNINPHIDIAIKQSSPHRCRTYDLAKIMVDCDCDFLIK